ncbi:MAG: dihydroorotate dehydrogenase electron transfer subunit [Candidatus Zixiibacteriota bacterium]
MKKTIPQICRVINNRRLDTKGSYYELTLELGHKTKKIFPGHFVHIKTGAGLDPFFRRAFSIAGVDSENRISIIYKIVGKGTALLGQLQKDDTVDIIGPLGNFFSVPDKKQTVVIAAGGVGLPPLLYFAEYLLSKKHPADKILFFYGGRTKDDLLKRKEIKKLGIPFYPCTDDGSFGFHGLITEAIEANLSKLECDKTSIYGCGPEPMLAALQRLAMDHSLNGEISLEAPMPCGVGVCLGCIKPRLDKPNSYVRVCYEGPVFKIGEVKL